MRNRLNRREILKLGGLTLGALAFAPFFPPDQDEIFQTNGLGRVSIKQISVYSKPRDDSHILRQRFRDEILQIYYELTPPTGPAWNPLWYRVWGGYVHSAFIQRVQIRHNPIGEPVRKTGQLGEVTVPYTQSLRYSKFYGWQPLYRLYYESTHWVTGIKEGPDGKPWYRITDELQPIDYFVPAYHIRLIPDEEFEPISPDVPFEKKRIEISLDHQTLTAYEGDKIAHFSKISSGIASLTSTNGIPTQTPRGQFNITVKMPSKHMGQGRLTDNLEDYELLGVPWTTFFHPSGYAIHGTFWHNNFGNPMSRGCVNMRAEDAKWIFRWTTPVAQPGDWERKGFGTKIVIF